MDNSKIMQDKDLDFGSQIVVFLSKWSAYIGLIILGIIGRFSLNLITNKKMTIAYVIGYSGLSFVVGYVACAVMLQKCPDRITYLLPLITMLSNNIISVFMTIVIEYKSVTNGKWKGILEIILKKGGVTKDGEE